VVVVVEEEETFLSMELALADGGPAEGPADVLTTSASQSPIKVP